MLSSRKVPLMTLLLVVAPAVVGFANAAGSSAVAEVHLVPHSHCDAGWLLSAQQYFDEWPHMPPAHTGSGGSVHKILDAVTKALAADATLRFVWAETIWLSKWWPLQDSATRATFQRLVDAGQIEFVGGGWVQNDETMTTFQDVIDQTTTGHEFLRRTFNATVKHGWNIDMFSGYSNAVTSLWALMGYEAMLLRYEGNATMRAEWQKSQSFEFLWQASSSLPTNQSGIFAHIVDGNYGDLLGQGFNWECGNPGDCKNNPPVTPSNLEDRAEALASFLRQRASYFRGPALMLFGSDFHWHNAPVMFGNMSLLMTHINANPTQYGITLRYSTFQDYLDAKHAAVSSFPVMPYIDFELGWPHHLSEYNASALTYQTGTHTSWATYKQLIRATDGIAGIAEQALAFATAKLGGHRIDVSDGLAVIRQARALVQHHDSVPGTMRTSASCDVSFYIGDADVKADYEAHLYNATDRAQRIAEVSVSSLACPVSEAQAPPVLTAVNSTRPMVLKAGEARAFAVYSALSWTRRQPVLVPVVLPAGSSGINITDLTSGAALPAQLRTDPVSKATVAMFSPESQSALPAAGLRVFSIVATDEAQQDVRDHPVGAGSSDITITNGVLRATFSGTTGWLTMINNTASGVALPIMQELVAYVNGTGGAYILYEQGPAQPQAPPSHIVVARGPVFEEVCQVYDPAASNANSVCFRLFAGDTSYVDVTHDIGPIALKREVVTRLTTDIDAASTLFTEDTGWEMRPRVYNASASIPANYHALVYSAYLRGLRPEQPGGPPVQLTTITPHTTGVASLSNGQMEVMLLRRLNSSDSQGPWPLNDDGHLVASLWLVADTVEASEKGRHNLIQRLNNPPLVLASATSPAEWHAAGCADSWSGLKSPLPDNVELASVFLRSESTPASGTAEQFVARVRHMFEKGAVVPESQPATVDVFGALSPVVPVPTNVERRTLSLAYDYATHKRRQWPTTAKHTGTTDGVAAVHTDRRAVAPVTLGPLEYATYVMDLPSSSA